MLDTRAFFTIIAEAVKSAHTVDDNVVVLGAAGDGVVAPDSMAGGERIEDIMRETNLEDKGTW